MEPFSSVAKAVQWYQMVKRDGLKLPLRAGRIEMRLDGIGGMGTSLDERIGEPAIFYLRLARLIASLSPSIRDLLLGEDHRALHFETRLKMLAAQHRLRMRLHPRFVRAGVVRGMEG